MGVNYNPGIVTNGLVLCLDAANKKSYSGSGNTWVDLSGSNNSGTLINSPTFSSANNGIFTFNGSNTDVIFGNNIQPTTITASIWVKPDTSALTGGYRVILDKSYGGTGWYLFLYNGVPTFFANGDTNNVLSSVTLINSWYNITGTYDGTTIKIYINGVLTGNTTYTGGLVNNSNPIEIMTRDAAYGKGNVYRSVGLVAQVQIYNRALSPSEVAQNFNALRGRYGI